MLRNIALVVIAVIGALLIYAATKPDRFSLKRSTTIAASPDKVFALINDLRQFNAWNPWVKMEPGVALTYDASSAGVGGAYSWKGEKTGAGRMQITDSVPPQRISAKLDFIKPFEASNRVDFTIEPQGSGSNVTWAMSGAMPYLNRLMTVFFDMEKTVGKDFEAGLANLKAMAEKP